MNKKCLVIAVLMFTHAVSSAPPAVEVIQGRLSLTQARSTNDDGQELVLLELIAIQDDGQIEKLHEFAFYVDPFSGVFLPADPMFDNAGYEAWSTRSEIIAFESGANIDGDSLVFERISSARYDSADLIKFWATEGGAVGMKNTLARISGEVNSNTGSRLGGPDPEAIKRELEMVPLSEFRAQEHEPFDAVTIMDAKLLGRAFLLLWKSGDPFLVVSSGTQLGEQFENSSQGGLEECGGGQEVDRRPIHGRQHVVPDCRAGRAGALHLSRPG